MSQVQIFIYQILKYFWLNLDKNENSSVLIIILYFLNLILISILLFNYFLNWKFNEAYFNAAPNRFRLQIQFMIFLNNIGFSYFYSLILFFFIVFSLIFFVYKEELLNNRKMLIKLLVLEFFILVEPFTILHSSIAYLIIAISIKRKEKAWLIPLVLIREQAFWILLGYYILSSENIDKKLVKYSIISSILYLIVRFIILKDAPYYYNEELFPIIVMLNSSVSKDIIIQASVMIPLTLVYSLFIFCNDFNSISLNKFYFRF